MPLCVFVCMCVYVYVVYGFAHWGFAGPACCTQNLLDGRICAPSQTAEQHGSCQHLKAWDCGFRTSSLRLWIESPNESRVEE